ncbi:unnamed protein product [Closterium sp. NIES-65]|nr:unnamed protein product [Closterium sp. NIES-65]
MDLHFLPHIVVINPHIKQVYGSYRQAFDLLTTFLLSLTHYACICMRVCRFPTLMQVGAPTHILLAPTFCSHPHSVPPSHLQVYDSYRQVYDSYRQAFDMLTAFPEIKTLEDNVKFTQMLTMLVDDHTPLLGVLARGVRECALRPLVGRELDLDPFLDNMLQSRISRRAAVANQPQSHRIAEHIKVSHTCFLTPHPFSIPPLPPPNHRLRSRISRRVIAEHHICLQHQRPGFIGVICSQLSMQAVVGASLSMQAVVQAAVHRCVSLHLMRLPSCHQVYVRPPAPLPHQLSMRAVVEAAVKPCTDVSQRTFGFCPEFTTLLLTPHPQQLSMQAVVEAAVKQCTDVSQRTFGFCPEFTTLLLTPHPQQLSMQAVVEAAVKQCTDVSRRTFGFCPEFTSLLLLIPQPQQLSMQAVVQAAVKQCTDVSQRTFGFCPEFTVHGDVHSTPPSAAPLPLPPFHQLSMQAVLSMASSAQMSLAAHLSQQFPFPRSPRSTPSFQLSMQAVVEAAVKQCADVSRRTFGFCPEFDVHGDVHSTFAYVPAHIEYMLFEILKFDVHGDLHSTFAYVLAHIEYMLFEILKFDVHGDVQSTFAYVPALIEYMLFEILKNASRAVEHRLKKAHEEGKTASHNASRAVVEHHLKKAHEEGKTASQATFPPVTITVCRGHNESTIKVSDQGGGIANELKEKVMGVSHGPSSLPISLSPLMAGPLDSHGSPMAGLGFGLPLSRLMCGFARHSLHHSPPISTTLPYPPGPLDSHGSPMAGLGFGLLLSHRIHLWLALSAPLPTPLYRSLFPPRQALSTPTAVPWLDWGSAFPSPVCMHSTLGETLR